LRLRAIEERIEADLALGRHADLVGELERLVAEHPLRERPRGQLMLALYRSGRQAEALQAYQDGRRLLAEGLGLDPGAALQQLEKQILTQDPALEPPPVVPVPKEEREVATTTVPKGPRRRGLSIGLAAIVFAPAALLAAFLFARGDPAPTVVPNSVVKIDPDTHEIVDVFRVGGEPYKPAIVGDYVFVSSEEDEILSRIDVRSGEVDAFGGLTSPAGLAAGADGTLWVGSFKGNQVWQIDADNYQQLQLIELPKDSAPWALALGGGSVWVSHNAPAAVSRVSARTGKLQRRYLHPFPAGYSYSAEVAYGEGAAWTAANGLQGSLLRVDALGGGSELIEVGEIPFAVTVGLGGVWVTDLVQPPEENLEPEAGQVLRVDPLTGKLDDVIPVGKRPTGVATGGGSVWVANGGETVIWKIDPRTNEVVDTIATSYYPGSLAYGHGFLWVSLHAQPLNFYD
jgi:outer membrane protein assembly factor BamB